MISLHSESWPLRHPISLWLFGLYLRWPRQATDWHWLMHYSISQHQNISFRTIWYSIQQWAISGKSPTKSDYGQAEEGAEGGVERLDLGRAGGLSQPPVGAAVRLVADRYVTSILGRERRMCYMNHNTRWCEYVCLCVSIQVRKLCVAAVEAAKMSSCNNNKRKWFKQEDVKRSEELRCHRITVTKIK